MPIEAAVEKAMDECIAEGILREFSEYSKAEVKTVCIYEYNKEEQLQYERECSFEEGRKAGMAEQQAKMEREQQRIEHAEQRIERAKQRIEYAKQRAAKAEAEIQRLRDELERLKSNH